MHNYPRDDHDSFVESPEALREFIDNRVAAAYSVRKPLVFGEFGIGTDGFKGFSEVDWYRAYLEASARAGAGGAMFWIITPDPKRRLRSHLHHAARSGGVRRDQTRLRSFRRGCR